MQVLKFGGTSVANAENISKVVAIIEQSLQKGASIVVVSALGGVTDSLLQSGARAAAGDETYKELLQVLEQRHLEVVPRHRLVQRQRDERGRLDDLQRKRWTAETNRRASRLSRGFRGIWDRLTGKHGKIRGENEREAFRAHRRDEAEKHALVERQLRQRQTLVKEIRRVREIQSEDMARLTEDVAFFMRLGEREAPDVRTEFQEAARPVRENSDQENKAPEQDRQRPDLGRDDGMDLGM